MLAGLKNALDFVYAKWANKWPVRYGSGGTTTQVYSAWVAEADKRAAATMVTIIPKPQPAPYDPLEPYETITASFRVTGQVSDGMAS